MHRRQFLAVTVPAVCGCTVGRPGGGPSCTDEDSWPPTVEVGEVELAPGDLKVVEIRAEGITTFQFDSRLYRCGSTDAPVRFGDVETEPAIDYQADSCPPTWVWENCTSATVSAPIHAAPTAATGEYDYGFRIGEDVGERHSRAYEYTVTVTED